MSYKQITEYLKENVGKKRVNKQFLPSEPSVLDLGTLTTKKADELLKDMKLDIATFTATKKISLQMDREVLEFPSSISDSDSVTDQNAKLEQHVMNLLSTDNFAIKLETEQVGGIFKWLINDNCLLLITVYKVDPSRPRHKSLPDIPYRVMMTRTSRNSTSYRKPFAKLIYHTFLEMRSIQKAKFTEAYRKFLDHAFQPFNTFLYNERLAIRNPKYRPSCMYIKREGNKNDDRGYLEIFDPPRQLTEGGNSIVPASEGKRRYQSVRITDYDEFERLLIIEDAYRIKDWPKEGTIFLEGDMASNLRKWNAIKNLRSRGLSAHAKLADAVIRPWGLPQVHSTIRSYYNPGISHDNPESQPQARAVDVSLANPDVTLIHGPPGTGKTTVIVEIIRHVIANGGRVIMCAPTHVAVDNVLERTEGMKGISAVRVGGRAYMDRNLLKYRLSDRAQSLETSLPSFTKASNKDEKLAKMQAEYTERMEKKGRRYLETLAITQANLVCGTTIGIARFEPPVDNPVDFDVLIIDEASKATVMEFLVPAVRAKKWILVGDHRQLPPYVNEQEIRIYVQRYFEEMDKEIAEDKGEGVDENLSDSERMEVMGDRMTIYNDRTNELIAGLRRYHEELHALGEGDVTFHWERIMKLFNNERRPIKSIEEMIKFALGSCFHYFFHRLDPSRNARLVVQHRMPSVLSDFLDQTIYNGQLKTSHSASFHGLELPGVPSLGLKPIKNPMTFISTEMMQNSDETPGRYKGFHNSAEALVISELIASFSTLDVESLGYSDENPMTIGVITYYVGQSREINRQLRTVDEISRTRGWKYKVDGKPINIRVSIVDRFQGQEQDIILLSLTRSNNRGSIGFLKNLQRVNVSLSRAKQNLLVVGNADFFARVRTKPDPVLKQLAHYCRKKRLIHMAMEEEN